MDERRAYLEADTPESLADYVRQGLKAGADTDTVVVRLQAKGLEPETARRLVESVRAGGVGPAAAAGAGSLLGATIGGLAAAAVGGLIWGLIAIATDYEIGWVAWGVGWLAGYGVVLFARGRRGRPLQLLAVTAAVLGIVLGKYLTFFHLLKEYVGDEYGAEAIADMSIFSLNMVQFFAASAGQFIRGFDALWILLAVGTAWGIPRLQQAELGVATA